MGSRRVRLLRWSVPLPLAALLLVTLLVGVALAATVYPGALDTSTTLNNDSSRTNAIIELERKLGIGASNAGSAATGHVLTKQGDGTTAWAAPPAGGGSGVTGIRAMSEFASPQAAVNAVPAGTLLIVDQMYTLTSTLTVNKALTIECRAPAAGFQTTTNFVVMVDVTASDVAVRHCKMDGGYPAAQDTYGVSFNTDTERGLAEGNRIINVTVAVGFNQAKDSAAVRNSIDNTRCSGIRLTAGGTTGKSNDSITVAYNRITRFQRGGTAGCAGIQTDGPNTEVRNRNHKILFNDIAAVTNGPADMVAMGFDQAVEMVVHGNTYEGQGEGEGLVLSGPGNIASSNRINNTGASCVLLWSMNGFGAVKDTRVVDSILTNCGDSDDPGQGVAIVSAAGDPGISDVLISGLRVDDSTRGIQSYNNGGSATAARLQVNDVNVSGNDVEGCNFVPNMVPTVADSIGC